MSDTVTVDIIENGSRNFVYRLTNLSDGTGETAIVKIDGSATGPLGVNLAGQVIYPTVHLKIREVEYDIQNMSVQLLWDATAPANALILGQGSDILNFDRFGGVPIPPTLVGATGKILLTTILPQVSSSYTIVIRGVKGIPQG